MMSSFDNEEGEGEKDDSLDDGDDDVGGSGNNNNNNNNNNNINNNAAAAFASNATHRELKASPAQQSFILARL